MCLPHNRKIGCVVQRALDGRGVMAEEAACA
jgi:hypothetical protein